MSTPFSELFSPPNAWDEEFISSLERKQRKAQDKADVSAVAHDQHDCFARAALMQYRVRG